MMRFAGLTVITAMLACQQQPGPGEGNQVRPSAREEPQTDMKTEEQTLRALRQAHSAAIASKNADSVVTVYAGDVVYLPHADKPETGRKAARDAGPGL